MNIDCWLQVLASVPPTERASCRLVCRDWCELVDFLDDNQKQLELVVANDKRITSSAVRISGSRFPYDTFCRLFWRFGQRLKSLNVVGFDQWSDHHLAKLVEAAPNLQSFSLISCKYFGGNYHNDFGFHSVTQFGWQTLANVFGGRLNELVLEDCDLESHHLALIITNFPELRVLNVANNSGITSFQPLRHLPVTMEVLKVGPKLSTVKRRPALRLHSYEMPIEEIVAWSRTKGATCRLRNLQLQGYLTAKLQRLATIKSLRELSIKYISFSSEELFNHEIDVLISSIRQLPRLQGLNLYQFNASQSDASEMQWLREHLLEHKRSQVATNALTKISPNLKSFALVTKEPLLVIEQFRLLNFVLTSSLRLEVFSLSCASFDAHLLHSNVNQTVLALLSKHGQRLKELRLENIFSEDFYPRLVKTLVAAGGACPRLERLIIDDGHVNDLIECVALLEVEDKRQQPQQLIFNISEDEKIQNYKKLISTHQRILTDYVHVIFRPAGRDEIGTSEEVDETEVTGGNHQQTFQYQPGYDDGDLSDLCQLIDSSFDLIGNVLDFFILFANYGGLMATYLVLLRPRKLFGFARNILSMAK